MPARPGAAGVRARRAQGVAQRLAALLPAPAPCSNVPQRAAAPAQALHAARAPGAKSWGMKRRQSPAHQASRGAQQQPRLAKACAPRAVGLGQGAAWAATAAAQPRQQCYRARKLPLRCLLQARQAIEGSPPMRAASRGHSGQSAQCAQGVATKAAAVHGGRAWGLGKVTKISQR